MITAEKGRSGSLRQMAPEILSGANFSADPAIDIWSLGCILYHMVVGVHPFEADNKQLIYKKIIEDPVKFPKASRISKECKELVTQMLTKSPQQRINMKGIYNSAWV
jgi:serine/threonine protein kinase